MSFRINAFYKFDSAFLSTLLLNIHALAAMKDLGGVWGSDEIAKKELTSFVLYCFISFLLPDLFCFVLFCPDVLRLSVGLYVRLIE